MKKSLLLLLISACLFACGSEVEVDDDNDLDSIENTMENKMENVGDSAEVKMDRIEDSMDKDHDH